MTSWVVIDAGILLATVLPDLLSQQAGDLLDQIVATPLNVAVPALFRYELVAVIRKHVHRGTLSAAEGNAALETVLKRRVRMMFNETLLRRGYALAEQTGRPTAYDSQYLAVAETLGCEFWTTDQRLVNAVGSNLSFVHWLGDFN